jgi:hypothetical protein
MAPSSHSPLAFVCRRLARWVSSESGEIGEDSMTHHSIYVEFVQTISRRPNRRESMENAPGPKRNSAVVRQSEKTNWRGSGRGSKTRENACSKAEMLQLMGVSAPKQNAPTRMLKTALSQREIERFVTAVPRTSAVAAQSRRSSNPHPAAPAGNIENSLCTTLRYV